MEQPTGSILKATKRHGNFRAIRGQQSPNFRAGFERANPGSGDPAKAMKNTSKSFDHFYATTFMQPADGLKKRRWRERPRSVARTRGSLSASRVREIGGFRSIKWALTGDRPDRALARGSWSFAALRRTASRKLQGNVAPLRRRWRAGRVLGTPF